MGNGDETPQLLHQLYMRECASQQTDHHHFLKIHHAVNEGFVALVSKGHIWGKKEQKTNKKKQFKENQMITVMCLH